MPAERTVASGLLALTAAAGLSTLADGGGVARLLVTCAFVLFAPGWAIAAALGLGRPSLVWSVAVGVGVAISILISTVMVAMHAWHPVGAMQVLAVCTAVALIGHLT